MRTAFGGKLTPAMLTIGLVIATAIFGCLRVIGYEYYNAVLWHNLRIEVHRLRNEQQQRLQEMLDDGSSAEIVEEVGEAA